MPKKQNEKKSNESNRLYAIGLIGAGALYVFAPVVFPSLWFVATILKLGAGLVALFTLYLFAVQEWPEIKNLF